MIPVMIGTRIAYYVDDSKASVMAEAVNVKTVRNRKKAIVRLLLTPMELGKGSRGKKSQAADSRKTTKTERPTQERIIYAHKPSSLYSPSNESGRKRDGNKTAPTSSQEPSPPRKKALKPPMRKLDA